MLLNCCYCPYIRTILKYVHHFANIAKKILIKYIVLFLQDMTEEQVKEVYAYTVMVADDTETCESMHRIDSESDGSKE